MHFPECEESKAVLPERVPVYAYYVIFYAGGEGIQFFGGSPVDAMPVPVKLLLVQESHTRNIGLERAVSGTSDGAPFLRSIAP